MMVVFSDLVRLEFVFLVLKIISFALFTYLQLNELVKLARELQHEDQKSAAESCQLAGQHIHSLWAKASQALVKVCMALHL